jgi:hypothetical protein
MYLRVVSVALRFGSTVRAVLRSAAVAIVALALGVLTAYAQGWLPQQMGSLANSTGSWALVAFALSLMATSGWLAAVFGSASLLALLAGYLLGAEMQGYPSSTTTVLFWGAAALLAGPLLGLSAFWIKTRRDVLAATGVGAVSGVLMGEGIYGLTQVADTTYPPYWWVEIVVGLILLLAVAWRRLLGVRAVVVSVGVAVLAAVAFVLVYRRGPILLLS